jgi:hypothetical protein
VIFSHQYSHRFQTLGATVCPTNGDSHVTASVTELAPAVSYNLRDQEPEETR